MKNAQGPTVNPEPGNLSRHFVGSLSRWTVVGSVGVSHIETRAPALLKSVLFPSRGVHRWSWLWLPRRSFAIELPLFS